MQIAGVTFAPTMLASAAEYPASCAACTKRIAIIEPVGLELDDPPRASALEEQIRFPMSPASRCVASHQDVTEQSGSRTRIGHQRQA